MIDEMEGEKAKVILEKHAQGKTPTEIMKETGYSMAWIRQVIERTLAVRKIRKEGRLGEK